MHHRNRIVRTLISACLVLAMTTGIAFASFGTAVVTSGPLRLREESNTSSDVLGMAPTGTEVELLSDAENGWYKVNFNGKVGYMSADYLEVLSTGSSEVKTGTTDYALNVRKGPGISYNRIVCLPQNTTVTILESVNGWYKINVGSVTGYADASYITVNTVVSGGTSLPTTPDEPSSEPDSGDGKEQGITTYALNVRKGPGIGYGKITTLSRGTTVTILESVNGWYKISAGTILGYVDATYIELIDGDDSDDPDVSDEPKPDDEQPVDDKAAWVNAGPLNVRKGPGTGYDRVGSLSMGASVTIVAVSGEWYKIEAGSLTGYVSAQYITEGTYTPPANSGSGNSDSGTSDNPGTSAPAPDPNFPVEEIEHKSAVVITGSLNVRTGPGTAYTKVGAVRRGAIVTMVAVSGSWYKITSGSLTGFVNGDYLSPIGEVGSSAVGTQAAALAMSVVGCPYVYGAEGPNAFDCSGLSYYIYGQLGYSLARGSSSQYRTNGTFVSIDNIEPGDLVFFFDPRFDYSGGTLPTTHMGIYVGNGQFIHASTTSYTVQYDDLYGYYYKYIVGFKRIG